MRYGDIYWAEPDPSVGHEQSGRRPALIVSSNDALDVITQVATSVPLTTRERGWATHVAVSGEASGLTRSTWAICEQVRTVSAERLQERIGVANAATLDNISRVLRYLLNLP